MTTIKPTNDAQLVESARRGDRAAFAEIYDRYADRLHTYCYAMLRSADDAADATHDTFLKASEKLDQLNDPDKLRAWLFAIARNEARAIGRRRGRETPAEDLSADLIDDPDPSLGASQAELADLVWEAADGLGKRDKELLTLYLVNGLEGEELAEVMEVSPSHVNVMVSRLKDRVERSIGALLIAKLGSPECKDLPEVLAGWDGTFSMEVRSRVNRHVKNCDVCSERRAYLVAPANVLPGLMMVPAPALLRDRVLISTTPVEKTPVFKKEWWSWIALAVVAVVLAVVGLNLSEGLLSQTPNQVPPTPSTLAVVVDTTVVEETPNSTSPPTTVGSNDQANTTAPTEPAALVLSQNVLDFGDEETQLGFTLTNSGGSATQFDLASSNPSFTMEPTAGDLDPGAAQDIIVTLDRETLEEGESSSTITLVWTDGELEVFTTSVKADNPILIGPAASPAAVVTNSGSACNPTQTVVSIRVKDTSELAEVVVLWDNELGPQETQMTALDAENYEATIGPWATLVDPNVRVRATDIFDNAGGTRVSLTLFPCS